MTDPGKTREEAEPGIAAAIRSRTAHVLHLTHNDLDAVGADAIHRMKYGDVFTIYSSVGKFTDLLSFAAHAPGNGDLLSISDLGYQKGVEQLLKKARGNGWRIEWRDHHRWTDAEITTATGVVDVLRVDTSTCGTGLVARDLMPGDPVATEVARVVCDYDLWRHEDPRSAVLGQILQRRKNRNYVRDCLVKGIFTDPSIEREYHEIQREMHGIFRRSRRHATVIEGKYRILFAPMYGYPSETAAFLRKEFNTQMEVLISPDGKFSLRTVPPVAHLIAREYHGGGHPNAAGGSFDFSLPERFIFWVVKKSRYFAPFVALADTM
jgi:oligoribonuclease NrnB/cAMP/cGMP phosphodiesterase (DHH superfamily)